MQACLSSFLVALDSNIPWRGGALGRQISTHIKVKHSHMCLYPGVGDAEKEEPRKCFGQLVCRSGGLNSVKDPVLRQQEKSDR